MIDAVATRFEHEFGRRPSGIWAAPGRVNLIGEHTDYNRGRCLPIALPHATYAALAVRDDGAVRMVSDARPEVVVADADRLGPGATSGWAAYVAGVVWALRRHGIDAPGVDVAVASEVPIGAGLSSSAALECSVAIGVCELAGLALDDRLRRVLVDVCGQAEREVAGAPTGGLDQTISLFATAGHALALDFDVEGMATVPWRPEDDDVTLLVVDTRAAHELTDGGYAARRRDCESAAAALGHRSLRRASLDDVDGLADDTLRRRARHVVTEIARVDATIESVRRRDWPSVGALFDASHASLRDDFDVSCAELDVACSTAIDAGAFGARMTGGGFGGSAIALVPSSHVDAVGAAVTAAFERHGWTPPGLLVATAGDGAARRR